MSGSRILTLGKIAEIRRLQRQAGDMRLSAASAVLQDRQRQHDQEQQGQEANEARWAAMLRDGFDLTLSQAWSGAIVGGAEQLSMLSASVSEARGLKNQATASAKAAHARAEAADDLERRARRQDRKVHERRLLLEISDRFAERDRDED